MYISTYLADALLDHALAVVAYTPPSTIYAGLFLTLPTDGVAGIEVPNSDYARIVCSFLPAEDNVITNSLPLRFPTLGLTASNWGTVTGLGLFDAPTAGNLLFYGPLQSFAELPLGSFCQFAARALTLSIGQDSPPPLDIDGGYANSIEASIVNGGLAGAVFTAVYDGGDASMDETSLPAIGGGGAFSIEATVVTGGVAGSNYTALYDGGNA